MIELKSTGHEKELVRQTLDEICEAGMQDQCMIASMSLDLLKEAKELRPEIKTVYISVLQHRDHISIRRPCWAGTLPE